MLVGENRTGAHQLGGEALQALAGLRVAVTLRLNQHRRHLLQVCLHTGKHVNKPEQQNPAI